MSSNNIHDEWLSLLEISGPFIAPPVLNEAFPQGLDLLDPSKRKRLRQTYEEWREALDSEDPEFIRLHRAWIEDVISNCLGFDEDGKGAHLMFGSSIPEALKVKIPEQGVTLAPEYVLIDELHDNKPLLLIQSYSSNADLQAAMSIDGWSATPVDHMVQLCRLSGCRLGLVTNGERWMLIDAPVGATTTFASWYARLWIQEPITLQAFVHLLGIRRFFVAAGEQIPALIDKSLQHQDEVTAALGEQVQRAVEVLIQSLDRADQDRNRELLKDVTPAELYEAGLTVMMRLVFLLSAEERSLLLMGDECYEENYAVSTLRMQLCNESEEILERRWDAWSRLLAVFRAVYGGIDHENMRLPALGGSLFNPDRFAFLEGRAKGSDWHKEPAKPLPIDNRTVLLLLESIQQYQGRNLSYRALDVEQIGYVYEGLLERTVKRTSEVILDVGATRSAEKPLISLAELESLMHSDETAFLGCLVKSTGSSVMRIKNDLTKPIDDRLFDKLLAACKGNIELRDRIKPYANLLRIDPWGYPLVYPANSFVVTTGSDRRETGSHYTPKPLTEAIVAETLLPVVYIGPAEGLDRVEWRLKTPNEILQLKICDPAMGSGAFLVQVCRFLSDRLIEAWRIAENDGATISSEGAVFEKGACVELMPVDLESRIVISKQLIAERCLYGVDFNPLAVELAKLSIWLITLSKDRPFGFLDHNLRYGDSLLGLQYLDQLLDLSMNPSVVAQQRLFGKNIRIAVNEAIELRKNLRIQPIRNIQDVELMKKLDTEAREKLDLPNLVANAFVASIFEASGNSAAIEVAMADINISAAKAFEGDTHELKRLVEIANKGLRTDLPLEKELRRPFHWPLEFPEVFNCVPAGFNAIVGNPPFLGGHRITGILGVNYRNWLVECLANGRRGSADLVAYFFLRVFGLLADQGYCGLLAVNTISEGDTRQVGLDEIVSSGATIYKAYPNEPWPGKAAVVTSRVHISKNKWCGDVFLSNIKVQKISSLLSSQESFKLHQLDENKNIAFQGVSTLGLGFMLTPKTAQEMIDASPSNKEVIFPYLNGDDLNRSPHQEPSRWAINFWDWSNEKAQLFSAPYKHVLDNVKPDRFKKRENGEYICEESLRIHWWQYHRSRYNLFNAIGRGNHFESHIHDKSLQIDLSEQVLVVTRVSKTLAFCFVKNSFIFSDAVAVFSFKNYLDFAVLQSSIHSIFAWQYSSKMKTDLRYTISDVFETFPRPRNMPNELIESLNSIGKSYHDLRKYIMDAEGIGLTQLYNKVRDKAIGDSAIVKLRKLQCDMDQSVMNAYGWEDIDLDHDFRTVPYLPNGDAIRYTISESARIEILRRLGELNLLRYKEDKFKMPNQSIDVTEKQAKTPSKKGGKTQTQSILDFGGYT